MRKISITLIIISIMIFNILSVELFTSKVYAEDTRIEVKEIEATLTNFINMPENGNIIKPAQFKVNKGNKVKFLETSGWQKKVGSTWEYRSSGTFTPGTWRYSTQVFIDGMYNNSYKLGNPFTIKVNNKSWYVEKIYITNSHSYGIVNSPEFTITNNGKLSFGIPNSLNIPVNYVGTPIKQFSVNGCAVGGTGTLKFSKVSGPNWITIYDDGYIMGTPKNITANNPNLVIRVTDATSKYLEATINVGATVLFNKTNIQEIEATSNDFTTIPINGGMIQNPQFIVTKGSEVSFSKLNGWQKKVGDTWKTLAATTFTPGTWRYRTEIRVDGNNGLTHYLGNPVTVKINGINWSTDNRNVFDTYSYIWATSPEITIADIKTHQITFMDGANLIQKQQIIDGEKVIKPTNIPTKLNCRFDDWYADSSCNKKFNFNDTKIYSDTIIYAKFIEQYDITLDCNGGINNRFVTSQLDKDTVLTRSDIENSFKDDFIITPPTNKEFSHIEINGSKWSNDIYVLNSNITMKIIWKNKIIKHTVTFKDGTNLLSTQSINHGEKIIEPTTPKKINYRFDGWYSNSTLTTKFNFTNPINADTIIYAKFIEQCKITLDCNGGTNKTFTFSSFDKGKILNKNDIENSFKNASIITPPTNKEFDYIEINGSKWSDNTYKINSNITMKIIWKDKDSIKILLGDLNNNTKVEANDAFKALQLSVSGKKFTNDELKIGDINKNGKIDANDAYQILAYSVGIKNTKYWK